MNQGGSVLKPSGSQQKIKIIRKEKVEQIDEPPTMLDVQDGDKKQKHMNKAEIYQAVRKARLRSNYMNRDLNLKQVGSRQEREKFQPYF